MNKIKIAIIDSGVYTKHTAFQNEKIELIDLTPECEDTDTEKEFGHGTAVYGIIRRCECADIVNIKIAGMDTGVEITDLIRALDYVFRNLDVNIINLSLGVNCTEELDLLKDMCKKITDKGIVIVAAFDNLGSYSYPAAFKNVIGVISGQSCSRITEFEYIEDCIVNIAAKGMLQRLLWTEPPYIFLGGNSFACAHVTVQVAKFMMDGAKSREEILKKFRQIAKTKYALGNDPVKTELFRIHKAALFPFNKEMHSLVRYAHMLSFEISAIYDSKYSMNVGVETSRILKDEKVINLFVQNIEAINWDEFDTLIIGHFDNLVKHTEHLEEVVQLLKQADVRGKNIYCFDAMFLELNDNYKSNIYYPKVDRTDLPPERFGMLYRVSRPVVGVFGTSSKQGKFTLQLKLRELFAMEGLDVGQIGTEPSSLLYGMDYVFPMGYNSTVHIKEFDVVRYLNYITNELCLQNKDIIIVGSQSGTAIYDTCNIIQYNLSQYEFLVGTQPDAVVLCINPFDTVDYIARTVKFIESSVDCKVIAFVVFPMDLKNDWGIYGGTVPISAKKYDMLVKKLMVFSIPVFKLGDEKDMQALCRLILGYFQADE